MVYICDKCEHTVIGKDAAWHRKTAVNEDDCLDGLVLSAGTDYIVLRKSDKANYSHNRIFYQDSYASQLFNGNGFSWSHVKEPKEVTSIEIRQRLEDKDLRPLSKPVFDKVCAKLAERFADKYFSTIFKRTIPKEAE
jgi:hypothetical protein